MPSIEPFKGLRYDSRRVSSLARVVTPPYDVISPEAREKLYRRDPYNFIRVVYGKERDPYASARRTLKKWIDSGILRTDSAPAVYPYEQEYRIGGKRCRRLGVIALVRLDSRVYPHEEIHGGPKLDRLRLMKAVQASLDPIFGLVPDGTGDYRQFVRKICSGRKPEFSFQFEGVRHRLWRVTDPAWIRKLRNRMRSKELVIADGHHRFEAARAYRDERRKKEARSHPEASYNFVMFYLSAAGLEDPGLLPTHRVVKVTAPARLEIDWQRPGIAAKTLSGRVEVTYTHDLEEAFEQLRRGQAQAVVAMPPPRLQEVLDYARASRRMPRKTTYFYPKLVSGLVQYPFEA